MNEIQQQMSNFTHFSHIRVQFSADVVSSHTSPINNTVSVINEKI